ncbi:hypothetical protein [Prauserella rugosa]|uniref:Uncharacterized protein n=1 Tax=Prauserella rugosa TaxID=43354 RepID=A0A660CIL8_9PSEU|nr:hypothetical protein [Prauserella rugosa]KID31943.1 hypothetical protein HQ32_00825 [Prauserella sp. Am3]KMS86000.1 hypothetical protein ACZ91_39280 [Streptomyces regensis]TWH20805.1 hypothetical protein JD82_02654 [Prauserella rugosa]
MTATLYLSSLESRTFQPVRECRYRRTLHFPTGKQCLLVDATLRSAAHDDVDQLILAARFEGATVDPIDAFPCFVFIARPLIDVTDVSQINTDDVRVVAWGELYRTAEDAEHRRLSADDTDSAR